MTDLNDRNPIEVLADEFVARRRDGDAISLADFAEEHPEFAEQILDLFPLLLEMEVARSNPDAVASANQSLPPERELGDYRILREIGRGGMGVVYEAEQISLGRHVALKVLPSVNRLEPLRLQRFQREARLAARLHHTNIVPVYGVGSDDDQHFYAMQYISGLGLDQVLEELRAVRKVATLETDGKRPSDPLTVVSRSLYEPTEEFRPNKDAEETEADLASRRTKPIAQDELATADSQIGHDSRFSESGGEYWRSVALVGKQVAEALQYAADQGILHRDIKPSNLLLDAKRCIWVTDFGLAKANTQADNLTNTGDIVGTLRYMAPERFSGDGDIRSDLYSLGLTLYELVTLEPAFEDTDRRRLIRKVLNDAPPRPRTIDPSIPRDLETIVLKLLAREPSDRYTTAAAAAEDCERFLEDRPVLARRISNTERLTRWCRRNPMVASLLCAFIISLVAGLIGVSWQWQVAVAYQKQTEFVGEQAETARKQAVLEKGKAEEARDSATAAQAVAETDAYNNKIARAQLLDLTPNFTEASLILDRCPPQLRGWEWSLLKQRQSADLMTLQGHTGWVHKVVFSPDGKWIASAGGGNPFSGPPRPAEIILWDADTGEKKHVFRGHKHLVRGLAFAPDGKTLASAGEDGHAVLWDVASGWRIRTLRLPGEGWSVAFNHAGTQLAVGCYDSTVVWNYGEWDEPVHTFKEVSYGVAGLDFSLDDHTLATRGTGHFGSPAATSLWDLATGKKAIEFEESIYYDGGGVTFSPDGKHLFGCYSNMIRKWEAATGKLVGSTRAHSGGVRNLAASRGRIASCGDDAAIRIWDLDLNTQTMRLQGHSGQVNSVAFSPDGHRLVSGGIDGKIKVWDLNYDSEHAQVPGTSGDTEAIGFSSDSMTITTVGDNGHVRKIDPLGHQPVARFTLALSPVAMRPGEKMHLSRDTRLLVAVARGQRDVICCDMRSGKAINRFQGHKLTLSHVTCNHSAARIASAARNDENGFQSEVKVWDRETGKILFERDGDDFNVTRLALSPSGDRLALAEMRRVGRNAQSRITIYDVTTGGATHTFVEHQDVWFGLQFSDDGKRLAAAGHMRRSLLLWDLEVDRKLLSNEAPPQAQDLAFSPDGQRVAIASRDTTYVINTKNGEFMLALLTRGQKTGSTYGFNPRVCWSPNGKKLMVASHGKHTSVWAVGDSVDEAQKQRRETARIRAMTKDLEIAADDDTSLERVKAIVERYRSDPLTNPYLLAWRGRAYARLGEEEMATSDLQGVAERGEDGTVLASVAESFARLGKWEEARLACEDLLQSFPGHSAGSATLSLILLYQGDESLFRKRAKQLLAKGKRPDSSAWLMHHFGLLTEAYLPVDHGEEVNQLVSDHANCLVDEGLPTLHDSTRRVYESRFRLAKAIAAYRLGKTRSALDQLQAIATDSITTPFDQIRHQFYLAIVLQFQEKPQQSDAAYQRALDLAQQHLGGVDHFPVGAADWRSWIVLQLAHREAQRRQVTARTHAITNDLEMAADDDTSLESVQAIVERYRAHALTTPYLLALRGRAYARLGEGEMANRDLQRVAAQGGDTDDLASTAESFARLGKWNEARQACEDLLQTSPVHTAGREILSFTLLHQGDEELLRLRVKRILARRKLPSTGDYMIFHFGLLTDMFLAVDQGETVNRLVSDFANCLVEKRLPTLDAAKKSVYASRFRLAKAIADHRLGKTQPALDQLQAIATDSISTPFDQVRHQFYLAITLHRQEQTPQADAAYQRALDLAQQHFGGLDRFPVGTTDWRAWIVLQIAHGEVKDTLGK